MTALGDTLQSIQEETSMHLPSITAIYLAVLALLYAALAIQVARLRQNNGASLGDNGSVELRFEIRAHANFAEYVPLITLMFEFLEIPRLPPTVVRLLMGALVVSQLPHPLGMSAALSPLQCH